MSTWEHTTIDLPEYWACYLINGDASGLDADELAQIDSYIPEGWEVSGINTDMFDEWESHIADFDGLQTTLVTYQLSRRIA